MKIVIVVFMWAVPFMLQAQKFSSYQSTVSFYSQAPVEDIAATNTQSSSLFDSTTGEIAFLIPIREFEFEKSLMKEHFNDKYMESDRFERATFQGKIKNYSMHKSGPQSVVATGKLTIHGQTKVVTIPGIFEVIGSSLQMKSSFVVALADYKIRIPKLLWQNIAEQIEIKLDFKYKVQ